MRVAIAGKGGVGKTTLCAALAREIADPGRRILAVDCDPNPNLAESFGLDSTLLDRFEAEGGLRPVPGTLALAREPVICEVEPGLWLLGGPPSGAPLADAVARGIAGVLLADRFDGVITDLGAGPELARVAVGGVLNPADVCLILTDGRPAAELAAGRIEDACRAREVEFRRVEVERDRVASLAVPLAGELLAADRPSSPPAQDP